MNFMKNKNISTNIGITIRLLRREYNLTQAQLSEKLDISIAYINLIENNRRNITVPLLLKLAKLFNISLSDLTSDDNERLVSDLMDIFSDTIFENHDLRSNDVKDFAISSPLIGDSVRTLYDKYQKNKKDLEVLAEQMISFKQGIVEPLQKDRVNSDVISDLLQSNNNYFEDLEDLSNLEAKTIGILENNKLGNMIEYLKKKFSINVNFLETDLNNNAIKRFSLEQKKLTISRDLTRETKEFLVAQQIGLLSSSDIINKYLDDFGVNDKNTYALGRTVLSNYYAGALLMPYDNFWEITEKNRYDIEVICNYFERSFEQVCHRLSTLNKPRKEGIPFHFLRVDLAGNISKRFSMSGLNIPRYSVACPKWNVYTAFLNPGKIKIQISKMLDGSTYLCIARTVSKRVGNYGAPETFLSVGLGFDLSYSDRCIYADGVNSKKYVPTGISCRTCERTDCRQRAFPPIHTDLAFNENIRGLSGYITPDL